MLLFMSEKDVILLADAAEEVVKSFWNAYHAYRYDMYVSFLEFLRENGVHARKISRDEIDSCGYRISEISVSLN